MGLAILPQKRLSRAETTVNYAENSGTPLFNENSEHGSPVGQGYGAAAAPPPLPGGPTGGRAWMPGMGLNPNPPKPPGPKPIGRDLLREEAAAHFSLYDDSDCGSAAECTCSSEDQPEEADTAAEGEASGDNVRVSPPPPD